MSEVTLEEARTLPASAYVPLGRTGRTVSRVGFGTYRVDDRHPAQREALELALDSGINLIDTSTNYGDGHSELLVGQVLKARAAAGKDSSGITLVTKAGYVQGSNQREAHRRFKAGSPWPEMTEYSKDCWHCISPAFLKDQITFSLDRLARPRVDVFLLHNPEYFLSDQHNKRVNSEEAQDEFHARLTRAFAHLETEVAAGRIGSYGISSNTFIVPRDRHDFVDLTRVLENAGPGFSVIQLPMNPVELGARERHHTRDKRSVLDVAKAAGLGVLVNRPLNGFTQQSLVRFAAIAPPFPWSPARRAARSRSSRRWRPTSPARSHHDFPWRRARPLRKSSTPCTTSSSRWLPRPRTWSPSRNPGSSSSRPGSASCFPSSRRRSRRTPRSRRGAATTEGS
jgi:hypothetical protein